MTFWKFATAALSVALLSGPTLASPQNPKIDADTKFEDLLTIQQSRSPGSRRDAKANAPELILSDVRNFTTFPHTKSSVSFASEDFDKWCAAHGGQPYHPYTEPLKMTAELKSVEKTSDALLTASREEYVSARTAAVCAIGDTPYSLAYSGDYQGNVMLAWISATEFKTQGAAAIATVAARSERAAAAYKERNERAKDEQKATFQAAKERREQSLTVMLQTPKAGTQMRCEATKRASDYSVWSDFSCEGVQSAVPVSRADLAKYGWRITSQQTLTDSNQSGVFGYREIILAEKSR